ncbi:MAG: NADH:ubiquinone reductase (Na(+)-transporting) subunit C [Flavobacteriales bacterium]|nr:NADH:ubiquinone reductase (Na(+)-transporting) subunit C [Flavobacteriales bacterium]
MAINKESNGYIILFSTVLVLVTAVVLVTIFGATNPAFKVNQELEKKQNILQAVKIDVDRTAAAAEFEKSVQKAFAINPEGKVMTNDFDEVFKIDLAKELRKKDVSTQMFPVYEIVKDGKTYFVVGMRGKGLWDAIWGYVSIEGDYNTIFGAVFDHKSETPGLGAEIKEKWFQAQFDGKKISDPQGQFVSVSVIKKGTAPVSDYNVDGVSGGTLTSNGLHDMLHMFLGAFAKYGETVKVPEPVKIEPVVADSLATDSLQVSAQQDSLITNENTNR